jgi:hypothetical protein
MREKRIGGIYRRSIVFNVDISFYYWGSVRNNYELHIAK